MKRIAVILLVTVMILSLFTACKKQEPQPVIPEEPELPGTLISVVYAAGSGMMARSDFQIRVNRNEVEHTRFWPEEYTDEMEVREHMPITEQQWADVETLILGMYRAGALNACQPGSVSENSILDSFVLDGGDYTDLSLVWETADGSVEQDYCWPDDQRVITLVDLLRELADPQGREIIWYEEPELRQIWITRKHKIKTDRDYSYQLYWADHDEDDPHWDLIYYLGKNGAVANGRVRVEDADWNAFLTLAEETQLEYLPEPDKTDEKFTCKLNYTNGRSKYRSLNTETEETLKAFFYSLIEKYQ